MKRIHLTGISGLNSIYKKKSKYLDVYNFNNKGQRGNFVTPDMAEGLRKLEESVRLEGGTFLVIDLFRDWETQAENRKSYETGKKAAFVAKPGGSFHNAGRAIDIQVKELNFSDINKDQWLKKFWDLAIPLGFRPIIRIPELGVSECWHFDFPGDDWKTAYDALSYSEVAKCATLDVGEWDSTENKSKIQRMFVQSQLIRLGHYQIGKVDGIFGTKTNTVLNVLGNLSAEELATKS